MPSPAAPDPAWGLSTVAIHTGHSVDPRSGALANPLHMSTTYAFATAEDAVHAFEVATPGDGQSTPDGEFVYARWGNPTQAALEAVVAALEGAEAAVATASGMAAISGALLMALKPGDHVVAPKSVYSATHTHLTYWLPRYGIEVTQVDATDTDAVAAALRPTTRLLYLESPDNPTLRVTDLRACAAIGHAHGALVMVDNTFATSYNQRPLELGVDVVLHSMTKYLCGHGDALGGAIVGRADWVRECRRGVLRDFGGVISPFNAWLIRRGVETFPLRMARHNANALTIATALEEHPAVAWVSYPGLPSHPQHALARRQMPGGFGAMLSFELKGGLAAGARMLSRIQLCTQAVSLGDTKTLVTHAPSTTHTTVPAEARHAAGITDGLVRMSVGLEDPADILADLDQALH